MPLSLLDIFIIVTLMCLILLIIIAFIQLLRKTPNEEEDVKLHIAMADEVAMNKYTADLTNALKQIGVEFKCVTVGSSSLSYKYHYRYRGMSGYSEADTRKDAVIGIIKQLILDQSNRDTFLSTDIEKYHIEN